MSQQDESLEEDSDFQELEQKLAGLKPLPPSEAFSRRLGNRLDAIASTRTEDKIVWMRFAPVAAAACVILTSAFLYRDHLLQQQQVAETEGADFISIAGEDFPEPAPVLNDNATTIRPPISPVNGRIVPASEGIFPRGEQDSGITGFDENGLLRRNAEIEFTYPPFFFGIEPETGLRYLIGPDEFMVVPVVAD